MSLCDTDTQTHNNPLRPRAGRTLHLCISGSQQIDVPVLIAGGGGFLISFDLPVGSTGYIHALDRDIALFLDGYTESAPATKRKQDFSSAIFVPSVFQGYQISESDGMTIQSLDGSVSINLTSEKIKMKAGSVDIDTENLSVTGDISADSLFLSGEASANDFAINTPVGTPTITLINHIHLSPSGNTGASLPVPAP